MRLGLAYNQRPNAVGSPRDGEGQASPEPNLPPDAFVEWDEPETIAAVADALTVFGEVVLLEAVDGFPWRLSQARVDFLFNIAEGATGPNREAQVPAIAEFLGIPYLGSDPLTLGLALHKGRAKEVLAQRGVPTAPFFLMESEADLFRLERGLRYPLFLKPAWEGSSKGIAEASRVSGPAAAVERSRFLLRTYGQPVLVETYLPGEEFTVAVLGNGAPARPLPIIRFRFDSLPDGALPIMGYEAKWLWDRPEAPLDVLECPAQVPEALAERLRSTALAAYHALGCRDWARVDLRLDGEQVPHVLEVNPLPGIIPDPAANSCFPKAAAAAGMSYDELIQTAAQVAWRRITGKDLVARTVAGAAA
jgi:D-alanine-D-alanine ligase